MDGQPPTRVVVVGGGFGGLEAVKALAQRGRTSAAASRIDVTLIDRNNYHLFQPLSYQVATGALSPSEIAVPLRQIFRDRGDVRVVMAEVTAIDVERRELALTPVAPALSRTIGYDVLIVAGGSTYAYFGHEEWKRLALEVKSLDSALQVRGRILQAFETAELEDDPERRQQVLTFVVVGAGPTGVEMAGQIAELAQDTLPAEFRRSDPRRCRVLLVEQADRPLTAFAPSLSRAAARSLARLGVTLLLGRTVVDVQPEAVVVEGPDGSETIATRTVVWAAGVRASRLAGALADAAGADVDRAGRIGVESDLTLAGHPEIVAIGDMVRVRDPRSDRYEVLPGVAPVAMQQGRHAARVVRERVAGRPAPTFRYRDKGMLATIGRGSAVAQIHGLRLRGLAAWLTWLGVHLFYLIGFQNRILVLLRWGYSFLTRGRGARLITEAAASDARAAE